MEIAQRRVTGGVGEMLVAAAFLKRGIPVYRPVVDTGVDLVVDINGKLQRIQIKSSADEGRRLCVHLGRRLHTDSEPGKCWARYEPGELDWYAVCCLAHNYIALVPAGGGATTLTFGDGRAEERLASIEINAVINRLLEEKDD